MFVVHKRYGISRLAERLLSQELAAKVSYFSGSYYNPVCEKMEIDLCGRVFLDMYLKCAHILITAIIFIKCV
jgi:hypothetical protein